MKLRIVRVLLVCSCLASSLANGDEAADISHIRGTLDILNEYVQADQMQFLQGWKQAELQALQNVVPVEYQDRVLKSLVGRGIDDTFTWSDSDNIRAYLEQLTRAMYGVSAPSQSAVSSANSLLSTSRNSYQQLISIRQLLAAISNSVSSSTVPITNIVNVNSGPDVLAGNPWWATNSLFAFDNQFMNQAYPQLSPGLHPVSTFPQFMSYWSSQLTIPSYYLENSVPYIWQQLFGNSRRSFFGGSGTTYTWFDWMAEAMKSNWVAQATEQRTLDAMAASLNGGSTNLVNVYVTNIVGGVTNILRADDILAANPWWATNSGFKISFHASQPEPFPLGPDGAMSFPEIFSRLAATHTRFQTPPLNDSREWLLDSWGYDRYNTRRGQLFTFEDWIAEMVRSNLVLTTSPSATNIDEELYLAGYDTDTSDTITNTPLPEYSLPSSETIPEAENVLQQGERSVTSFIESLPQPGTGGDPEIVLIPEFSVGGIHVPEYRASLSSPIVPTCHAVMSFLYSVGLACFIFSLAKGEYVYYASIGRHWGKKD